VLEQPLDLAERSVFDNFVGRRESLFVERALNPVEQTHADGSLLFQRRRRCGKEDAQGDAMGVHLPTQARDFIFHVDSPVLVGTHRMNSLPGASNRARQGPFPRSLLAFDRREVAAK